MFCVDLDGSHTTVYRGGECYGYQGRKKRKTTNGICTTDRQGIQIATSTPVSGTHNDLHNISAVLGEFFTNLKTSAISTSDLFLNADTGFDSAKFRRTCLEYEVFPNVASNPKRDRKEDDVFFDELLYGQTYCIERTNAWMDSCRSLLNRFDTKLNS